ncbi:MAG: alpha/beta fold hydrolase [Clostridia bacterium]|nr:alpha/beta fold hydrolase [Clostridia bacterium]
MAIKTNYTFASADGVSAIHAVRWLPVDGNVRAVLQIVHGMVEYIERYTPFAEFLTTKGYAVFGHDHIGHGDSVSSPEEWGIMHADDPSDVMVADMFTNYKHVKEEYPDVPYYILGHSMGSYMLRKYLSVKGAQLQGVNGAIVMGTGTEPAAAMGLVVAKTLAKLKGRDYRAPIMVKLTFGAPYKMYDLTGQDAANSWLTKNEAFVKKYYNDPKCTYLFSLNGYIGLLSAVKYDGSAANVAKIPKNIPILFASGDKDPVGNHGKGVQQAYDLFKAAGIEDVTLRLFEGDRHEILNETDSDKVFAELYDWMESKK